MARGSRISRMNLDSTFYSWVSLGGWLGFSHEQPPFSFQIYSSEISPSAELRETSFRKPAGVWISLCSCPNRSFSPVGWNEDTCHSFEQVTRKQLETKVICLSTNIWELEGSLQKINSTVLLRGSCRGPSLQLPPPLFLFPSGTTYPIDSDTLCNRPRHAPKPSLLGLPTRWQMWELCQIWGWYCMAPWVTESEPAALELWWS